MTDVAVRELGRTDLDALLEAYRDLHPDDDPLPARAELDRLWDLSGSQRGAAHQFYERNGFDKHAKQGFVVRR